MVNKNRILWSLIESTLLLGIKLSVLYSTNNLVFSRTCRWLVYVSWRIRNKLAACSTLRQLCRFLDFLGKLKKRRDAQPAFIQIVNSPGSIAGLFDSPVTKIERAPQIYETLYSFSLRQRVFLAIPSRSAVREQLPEHSARTFSMYSFSSCLRSQRSWLARWRMSDCWN